MTPLQRLVHYITIANFLLNTCNFIGLKPLKFPVPLNQVVTTQSRLSPQLSLTKSRNLEAFK